MNPPDILLTHGYFLFEDPEGQQTMKPYVPLGMLYLSSHLKRKEFRVEIFDSTFVERDEFYERMRAGRPSTLCISSSVKTRDSVMEILGVARLAGWTTIVEGSDSGTDTQGYLDAGANFVVLDEPEATMAELLAAINIGATEPRLAVIHGIAYLGSKGDLRETGARAQLIDLDAQPWPDREAVDLKQYLDTWRTHHGKSSLHFITARRSCRCSQIHGDTYRTRSAKLVVDEIEFLVNEYHPDQLFADDDSFTTHLGWLSEFAAEMKARNLRIPLECVSSSVLLNEEVSDLLADLGCHRVWVGSERSAHLVSTIDPTGMHAAAARVEA